MLPISPIAGYRLVRRLGNGRRGAVWEAENTRGHRSVVKLVSGAFGYVPCLARVRHDASLAFEACPEHVVRMLEARATGRDRIVLVTSWIEGQNLEQRLNVEGPMGLSTVLQIVEDSAHALAAVHRCGIVHHGLEPRTLFLDGGDVVTIVDFGLAPPRVPARGATPYHAPEQIHGQLDDREVDLRADLYALAAIVYRCLAGRPLTIGRSSMVRVEIDRPDLPVALSRVLDAALARDPRDRPSSAAELHDRLRAAILDAAARPSPTFRGADETQEDLGWLDFASGASTSQRGPSQSGQ